MRHVRHRLTLEMLERIAADAFMVSSALAGAFIVSVLARLWFPNPYSLRAGSEIIHEAVGSYARLAPFLTPLCLAIFLASGFYTHGRFYRGRFKALIVLQAVTVSYAAFGAGVYAVGDWSDRLPLEVWIGGWLLTLLFVGGLRLWSMLWRATVWTEARIMGRPQTKTIRNVTVIGGAGYIGSILCRLLVARGYHVTVLDALVYGDQGIRDLIGRPGFDLIHGDVRDVEVAIRAIRFSDAVVHLGALVGDPVCDLDERLTIEVNLAATRLLAEVARGFGVQRFVFASTCSVYGASDETLDERSALKPVSLYARTKMDSERILLGLTNASFSPTILRFATVYGMSPRPRFDLVVNVLAAYAVRDRKITIHGGDQWRPFVHVADAAQAVVDVIEAPSQAVRQQIFNVGSDDQNLRIREVGELVTSVIPNTEMTVIESGVDRRNYRVSFAKIRRVLRFAPARSIREGIEEVAGAVEGGALADFGSERHSNVRALTTGGEGHPIRRRRITPLYAATSLDEGAESLDLIGG